MNPSAQLPDARGPWQVVIIEDSADDRAEIRRLLLLGSGRRYAFAEAPTGAAGIRAVRDAFGGPPDCVVLDYNLPDMDAVELLTALAREDESMACPVVVTTESADYELSRALLRAGAQDYVGKDWMTPETLTRAVENARERWAMARDLREGERRFRLAARVAGLAVAEIDYATDTARLTPDAASLLGLPPGSSVVPRAVVYGLVHPDDRAELEGRIARSYDPAGSGEFDLDHRIVRPDGRVRWLGVRKQVFFAGGRPSRALLAMTDITARKQAEEDLRAPTTSWSVASPSAPRRSRRPTGPRTTSSPTPATRSARR